MRLLLIVGSSFFLLLGCHRTADTKEVPSTEHCFSEQEPYLLFYLLPDDCKSCMPGFTATVENAATKYGITEQQIVLLGGEESRRVELEYMGEQHLKSVFGEACRCILQSEATIKRIQQEYGLHEGSFYAVNDGKGSFVVALNFK